MKELVKQLIKHTPLYPPLKAINSGRARQKREEAERRDWERRGRPEPPPPVIKQMALRKFAEQYRLRIFVETGTYIGDTVEAMKHCFDKIYSIELSEELFEAAKQRFASEQHIELVQGDSGKEIEKILGLVDQPALFWLDGHYSAGVTALGEKETPIYEELDHILNAEDLGHVIVIDDARCFGGNPVYPTVENVKEFVKSKRHNVKITVEEDSIRIFPVK